MDDGHSNQLATPDVKRIPLVPQELDLKKAQVATRMRAGVCTELSSFSTCCLAWRLSPANSDYCCSASDAVTSVTLLSGAGARPSKSGLS